LTEIVGVRFKNGGKTYFFSPQGLSISEDTPVIVETARGPEYGTCVQSNTMVEDSQVVEPLRCVLRIATEEDQRMLEANRKKERWAMEVCQKKIQEHQLDMKLVSVQYSFDGSKVLFFFTSDGRVDFRELVKDLASVFRTRIELRQIGVRDEAKMLGGLGICGQPFCCSRFLGDFQPVSIKMAKTQNLSLNPTKISGTCGRLMCCLKYEQEAYEDLVKHAPKQDSFVETPDGVGTVSSVSLLREQAKVQLDIAPETPRLYPFQDIRVIRAGKGKRPEEYAPAEVLQAEYIRKTMEETKEKEAQERKAAAAAAGGDKGKSFSRRERKSSAAYDKPRNPRENREKKQDQRERKNEPREQKETREAKENREQKEPRESRRHTSRQWQDRPAQADHPDRREAPERKGERSDRPAQEEGGKPQERRRPHYRRGQNRGGKPSGAGRQGKGGEQKHSEPQTKTGEN
jgi:cell fate regulator YaaT (PSP1 superfamily)